MDMSDNGTNFPPQTYSSLYDFNGLIEDEKNKNGLRRTGKNGSTTVNRFIRTMYVYMVLLICNVPLISTKILECIVQSSEKTRTFHSLRDYQANDIPFDPRHMGFLGNHVNFDFVSIDRIPRNAFITYNSENLVSLSLSKKGIVTVDPGAFNSLFCLHRLDLDGNFIANLSAEVFQGLDTLRVLNLSGNMLEFIPRLLFSNLRSIKQIDLSNNVIKRIDSMGLRNATTLEALYLGNNKIKAFPATCFVESTNLKVLDLYSNFLTIEGANMLQGLERLEYLNLSRNHIATLNFENDTYVWENLKVLNVSGNVLANIDVPGLRNHFPTLRMLDINDNNFLCTELDIIFRSLRYESIDVAKGRYVSSHYSIQGVYCKGAIVNEPSRSLPVASTVPHVENYDGRVDASLSHWLGFVSALTGSVLITVVLFSLYKTGIAATVYDRIRHRVTNSSLNPEYISLNS
ncbi:leucine-rich repeat-containing protein 70 isoform X2 [Cylas formicarius]|uniref:leucine-rich repeat-containing protein 70 isoform X2 n=1 Tax=Cylas formicarius TaxID=197179 RepID=UPI0029584E67|nr:leucine-rich repeat-containing protein 70 isoform X2 [Cylas formicarius]